MFKSIESIRLKLVCSILIKIFSDTILNNNNICFNPLSALFLRHSEVKISMRHFKYLETVQSRLNSIILYGIILC